MKEDVKCSLGVVVSSFHLDNVQTFTCNTSTYVKLKLEICIERQKQVP